MSCSVNYFAGVFKNLSMAAILNSLASVLIIGKKSCLTVEQGVSECACFYSVKSKNIIL